MPVSITKQLLAAAAYSTSHVDIIAVGSDNAVYHQGWNTSSWQGDWDSLGGSFAAVAPTLVSWGPDRLDAFARDRKTDHLAHNSWNGDDWGKSWPQLGSKTFTGSFAAVSWEKNRLDVFGRGDSDRAVYHQWVSFSTPCITRFINHSYV